MGLLKTFKLGGVHPDDNKLSAKIATETLPLPKRVSIVLAQHIGAPAKAIVKKGDLVKVGQLIGEAQGFISANIHSSVSGKVFKVDTVLDSSGYRKPAVIIDVDGDEWLEDIDRSEKLVSNITMEPKEIIAQAKKCGIVGLGGATFPTHVKLGVPPGKKVDTLVMNGVECEPYLTDDHRLMIENGAEIVVGIRIIMKSLGVKKAIIGIENNKPDAIKGFNELLKDDTEIMVQPLEVKYPQGGEKQLIKAVLNREVPSGKLPLDVGVVVQNIGTAFALYEAVQKNKPLIDRIVTVTGLSLEKPANFKVRIGIPMQILIDAVGGIPEDTGKIIDGGAMMGKALNTLDIPVLKRTSSILFIPKEIATRKVERNCIRCGRCAAACPMGLEPYLLENLVNRGIYDRCDQEHILDCMECGCCSFTCPANRALLDRIRVGKMTVLEIRRGQK